MDLRDFYANSEIFVTGGSGVVGKALLDKLLRSCNVRRIYVLLRSRKNLSAEERLVKLRQANVFELLREQNPEQLNKLVAIPGDVTLPLLGISAADRQLMQRRVSFVYHCAATVRFDEPLRVALQLNVSGTLEALKFAETLPHLKLFMHVSTFYSNPYLERVEPKYYAAPIDWRKCLQLLEQLQDERLFDALTGKMIVGFPNTYTFTKNLAESLVNDYRHKLPVIVYRPSIVLFSISDPVPGFSPSLMGAMGLFSLVGAGILKTVYLGNDIRLDITPHDLAVKGMLYYTHSGYAKYQQGTPAELPVYQSSSCTHVPHTFKQMGSIMDEQNLWFDSAFEKCLLIPGCHYTDNRWSYMLLVFVKQIVPALLVDLLLLLFGRKPLMMGIVRKAYGTLQVMQPFMFNNYDSPGTTDVQQMIKDTAGTEFDVTEAYAKAHTVDFLIKACANMLASIRWHLLKEKPETLPRAQRILQVKFFIYHVVRLFLLYKLLSWLWRYLFP